MVSAKIPAGKVNTIDLYFPVIVLINPNFMESNNKEMYFHLRKLWE